MKKILVIVTLLALLLSCTSCNTKKENDVDNNDNGKTVSSENKDKDKDADKEKNSNNDEDKDNSKDKSENQGQQAETKKLNKAIEFVGKSYFEDEKCIAVNLNDLSGDEIKKYKDNMKIDEYIESEGEESVLIIPKYEGMKISYCEATMDGEKLVKGKTIYESTSTDNYGFLFQAYRPEGMPLLLTIEGDNINIQFEYFFDGKGDRPQIQQILTD